MTTARLAEVKHFAVHDGPGIRTTFFFKGCPLRCKWCHNPETQTAAPELALLANCVRCGRCAAFCDCHTVTADGHTLDRARCRACGKCVESCLHDALVLYGRQYTLDEMLAEAMLDRMFYGTSGGVTASGGEPLMQSAFVAEFFARLRAEKIHCALDTCGEVDWSAFEAVLPHTDMVLYDLKCMDPELHRKFTGRGPARLLENLRRVSAAGIPVEIRMPIIPGWNDSPALVADAGRFLAGLPKPVVGVRLLAYHAFSHAKYQSIGHPDTMPDAPSPGRDDLLKLAAILTDHGVRVLEPGG